MVAKNWLFVGSELAGQRAAVVMSLVQSAKLNRIEPWAYLRDVLARLHGHQASRIDELLPHRWQPSDPRVTLELGCTDRTVDLIQQGVDCALRGGRLPDSQLTARPVGDLRFVLCAAPGYLEQHGAPTTPEDLARHHQIGYMQGSTGKVSPVRLARDGQAIEIAMPARFVTTDSAAVLSAGLGGLGIVQQAEFVADPYLASGALVRVLPDWQCPPLPLYLVTTTARKRTARVQAFMDWAHALLIRRLGSRLETR